MFTIFVDNIVTLQAGTPMADGHQIEAHKVILAASSPFFTIHTEMTTKSDTAMFSQYSPVQIVVPLLPLHYLHPKKQ